VVLEERIPSLFSCLPTENPGLSLETKKAEIPLAPFSRSVLKKAMMTSAKPPFVVKFLVPLRTKVSPSRTAVARIAPGSLPAPASVSEKHPSHSPDASLGR